GKPPYGRTYDRDRNEWGLDKAKHKRITEIAKRVLAGESVSKLATEHGFDPTTLGRFLQENCGDTWEYTFDVPDLNIRQAITYKVPRLLDEDTIQALRLRIQSNRTYVRGKQAKHDYLLNGHIFCAGCGTSLTGQPTHSGGKVYLKYRHSGRSEKARK